MSSPSLESIFDYLALLIAERGTEEPLLLSQIGPALNYKFPSFAFAPYGLAGLKEFILAGQKAGYFTLVNTGDARTAYLSAGSKAPRAMANVSVPLAADDPRRQRWMTELMENLLNAERADQLVSFMKGTEALSPEFDKFLAAREHTMELYPVRGKLRRVRQFLAIHREQGETAALTAWQPNRVVLRMPPVPPIKEAPAAGSTIMALMQGNLSLNRVPLEALNNTFFAVLRFLRTQLAKEKAHDWVIGLEILEAQARAVPRPQQQAKATGLFGRGQKATGPEPLDDDAIEKLTRQLMRQAGASASLDESAIWRAFAATESLDAAVRFLEERPALATREPLLIWLDDEISRSVENGDWNAVRALATKSALLLIARKVGLEHIRKHSAEMKTIYESVMEGARLLGLAFAFLKANSSSAALAFLQQNRELTENEAILAMIGDQMEKAARAGDVARYRAFSERANLLNNVAELGPEQGAEQHARWFINTPRTDRYLMMEMGLLLLPQADTIEERRDILERYPVIATREGLGMINTTLDVLSFRSADPEEFARHHEAKRLIERCIEIGIDRALVELK